MASRTDRIVPFLFFARALSSSLGPGRATGASPHYLLSRWFQACIISREHPYCSTTTWHCFKVRRFLFVFCYPCSLAHNHKIRINITVHPQHQLPAHDAFGRSVRSLVTWLSKQILLSLALMTYPNKNRTPAHTISLHTCAFFNSTPKNKCPVMTKCGRYCQQFV